MKVSLDWLKLEAIDNIANWPLGGLLLIYVYEQNGAIFIGNKGIETRIECFELSPNNEAVMLTKSRL